MAEPVSRSVVQAFYEAYASRDPVRIAPLIADHAKWSIVGPSHIFPFCGEREGKAAVMELFTDVIPSCIRFHTADPEVLVVDGDCAAAFVKLTGELPASGRVITYHCGQFVRFENDKVISFHSLIDSFDAAEQALGHQIDPMLAPDTVPSISPNHMIVAI
jgi:ketosteroid isomerase-like protein